MLHRLKFCHFLLCTFLLLPGTLQAYDRSLLSQWLQEQAYARILVMAAAVPADSQDNYLLHAAGYAAFQNSQPDRATGYFQQALRNDSADKQALLYLGLIAHGAHRDDEAVMRFNRLLQSDSGSARYYRLAASCYENLKMPDTVLRLLRAAYMIDPGDLPNAHAYADALLDQKKYHTADTVIRKALLTDFLNAALLTDAIRSAYLQKNWAAALPYADKLILNGKPAYIPILQAQTAALMEKEYARCLGYTQMLLLSGYETEQVLYTAARAYAAQHALAAADTCLAKCVRLAISPHAAAYLTELGDNAAQLKNYRKAQQYLDTALYLTGDNMVRYRKALAYDQAGQAAQARQLYRQLLDSDRPVDTAVLRYARSRMTPAGAEENKH